MKTSTLMALGGVLVFAAPALMAEERPYSMASAEQGQRLEEIVVTAQRRAESAQDTPLAISAFAGDALLDRQVSQLVSLASLVPGASFGQSVGQARLAIRGIGFDNIPPGGEGRIAYHVDGIYVSRPAATMAGFFDVDRIEVLRGPQGTLYGRNATGGSINVITKGPTDVPAGYARLTVGNYDQQLLEAALGGPIGSVLSGRIAVKSEHRNGYGTNEFTGHDVDDANTWSFRGQIRYQPSTGFDALLSMARHRENDRNYVFHYLGQGDPSVTPLGIVLGGSTASDVRDVNHSYDPENDRTFDDYGLRMTWTLSDSAALHSLTGYGKGERFSRMDLDQTETALQNYYHREDSEQLSQELQLNVDRDQLSIVAGAYYFSEDVEAGTYLQPWNLQIFGLGDTYTQGYFAGGTIEREAWALYGQIDWRVSNRVTLTAGLRYSDETAEVRDQLMVDLVRPYSPDNPIIPVIDFRDDEGWDALTPRLGVQFTPRDALQLYVTASRGFKSGGYNLGGGGQPPFRPELLWSYEAGIKADWLGETLRTNLALFHYDYEDIQVTKVVNTVAVVENAASAEVDGIELEGIWTPTPAVSIDFSAAWLDARYVEFETGNPIVITVPPTIFDLSGNRMQQAPEYTATLGIDYALNVGPGDLTLRAEGYWSGKVFFTAYEDVAAYQPARSRYNLFATWKARQGGLSVSAFVRNIGDEVHRSAAFVSSGLLGFAVVGGLEPPRTYGLTIGYSF